MHSAVCGTIWAVILATWTPSTPKQGSGESDALAAVENASTESAAAAAVANQQGSDRFSWAGYEELDM